MPSGNGQITEGRTTLLFAWALSTAVTCAAVLTLPTIGLYVLPVGIVSMALAATAGRCWPESLGSVIGAGSVLLLVAFLNRNYRPCPAGTITVNPGQASVTCGGFPPWPWLYWGTILVGSALIAYGFAVRWSKTFRPSVLRPRLLAASVVVALSAIPCGLALLVYGYTVVRRGGH